MRDVDFSVSICCRIKFQELQEAWDQQECTSTVSVPIPASRHFEDAFIPYADRDQPVADRGTCPVLYAANGTVGVLHFGLSTGDVKLNGRCATCSALPDCFSCTAHLQQSNAVFGVALVLPQLVSCWHRIPSVNTDFVVRSSPFCLRCS